MKNTVDNASNTGLVVWSRVTAGVRFTEVVHTGGGHAPLHAHRRACLNLVVAGVYHEQVRGVPKTHPAGSVIYKPAEELHLNRFESGPVRVLVVEPSSSQFEQLARTTPGLTAPWHLDSPSVATGAARLYADLLAPATSETRTFRATALLFGRALQEEYHQRTAAAPCWLRSVRAHLDKRAADPFSLDELAGLAGVCTTHLARSFRQHTGHTIGGYVRHRRVARVIDRLVTSNDRLAALAAETGFADESHMIRTFRALIGRTPGVFRRAVRRTAGQKARG